MTIKISTARSNALIAAGQENSPIVTGAAFSGTYSTTTGTQTLAASNAATGTTFDPWAATPASGVATWQVVFGSAQAPTLVGIAAHNLATITSTVSVQYSTNGGSTWVDCGAGSDTPTTNQEIVWRFQGISATHWRVRVTSADATVSIGVIWIGQEIVIPSTIYQGYRPPITSTMVDLNTNVSEGNHLIGTSYTDRGIDFQAQFTHIEASFIRSASWTAFQERWNKGNGSFWAWRPAKYGDVHYTWRSSSQAIIAPTNEGPTDRMSFTIAGRGYSHD